MAHLHLPSPSKALLHLYVLPPRLAVASVNPFGLTARSLIVVEGIRAPGEDFNREELRVVEIPAGGGMGDARSIAKLYGSAATGGSEIGLSPTILDALKLPAISPTKGLRDKVLQVDMKFSLGFSKPSPTIVFGSSDNAFGTPGAGGSFGFADPDIGVGFAYVPNRMGHHLIDPRERALRNVLFHDILGARIQT